MGSEFLKHDPRRIWKCRDAVLSSISLIDVLREYGVEVMETSSGNFSHKARCPLPLHRGRGDGGQERTPSFYISTRSNDFYCFGCSSFGNAIDLISLIEGIPSHMALEKLAARAGLLDEDGEWDEDMIETLSLEKEPYDPLKTIDPYVMDTSVALRRHLTAFAGTGRFDRELTWVEEMGRRIDTFVESIGHEDWEQARDMRDKVIERISRRRKGR